MTGVPVVVSENGIGIPVNPVPGNAPLMTVATNGAGTPIVLSPLGAPFIVDGGVNFGWATITLTAGDEGQWVGYSDGGSTRPQPAFGSISAEPTSETSLLALYDDTASNVYIAVFAGEWLGYLGALPMDIGGFSYSPFSASIISGNTWIRYAGTGPWISGSNYQVTFG